MKLLSPKQAAALANVSYPTIRYWVKTGRLAKHPYPLAERSKEIYKRDTGVRRYLLSETEVLSNGTFGDIQTVRKKFPDLDLMTTGEAASAFFRTNGTISRIVKRHGLRKYRYGRGNEYLIDGQDLRRALLRK
jgi:hypothetical protein